MERQQILGDIGEEHDVSEAARARSTLGGVLGRKARAAKLSPEEEPPVPERRPRLDGQVMPCSQPIREP